MIKKRDLKVGVRKWSEFESVWLALNSRRSDWVTVRVLQKSQKISLMYLAFYKAGRLIKETDNKGRQCTVKSLMANNDTKVTTTQHKKII